MERLRHECLHRPPGSPCHPCPNCGRPRSSAARSATTTSAAGRCCCWFTASVETPTSGPSASKRSAPRIASSRWTCSASAAPINHPSPIASPGSSKCWSVFSALSESSAHRLLGHSLGGWIVAAFALQFPDLVDNLILNDSAGLDAGAIKPPSTCTSPHMRTCARCWNRCSSTSAWSPMNWSTWHYSQHLERGDGATIDSVLQAFRVPDEKLDGTDRRAKSAHSASVGRTGCAHPTVHGAQLSPADRRFPTRSHPRMRALSLPGKARRIHPAGAAFLRSFDVQFPGALHFPVRPQGDATIKCFFSLICIHEETPRGCAVRRAQWRARSLAAVGGVSAECNRQEEVRRGAHWHHQGRPLGYGRPRRAPAERPFSRDPRAKPSARRRPRSNFCCCCFVQR